MTTLEYHPADGDTVRLVWPNGRESIAMAHSRCHDDHGRPRGTQVSLRVNGAVIRLDWDCVRVLVRDVLTDKEAEAFWMGVVQPAEEDAVTQ